MPHGSEPAPRSPPAATNIRSHCIIFFSSRVGTMNPRLAELGVVGLDLATDSGREHLHRPRIQPGPLGIESLVDAQGRYDGGLAGDDRPDAALHGGTGQVHVGLHLHVCLGALVGHLAGDVVAVGDEPVLQRVDAERGGLGEGDRAEMAGHAQARAGAPPRPLRRSTSRVTPPRNLNQVAPLLGPLGDHHAPDLVRRGDAYAFTGPPDGRVEVRAGHVEAGPGIAPRVHLPLQIQLDSGRAAARGHGSGDAEGEVEERRGDAHLGELLDPAEVGVLVQAHETGQRPCGPGDRGPGRRRGWRSLADGPTAWIRVAAQDDGLVGARRAPVPSTSRTCVRATRRVYGDERRRARLERRLLGVE